MLVEQERHDDDRGFFARTYCDDEFAAAGLPTAWPQHNVSHNARAGTLRGMHYNAAPHREAKLVRCVTGAIWDAIVDLRPDSPTHLKWFGVELSSEAGNALYVPEGFAHGFITLQDRTDVFYLMGKKYQGAVARGFRWNDPLHRDRLAGGAGRHRRPRPHLPRSGPGRSRTPCDEHRRTLRSPR